MRRVVDVPRNAFALATAEQSGLLIDARNYYRAVYHALEQAQHYAIVSGWQFESGVRLLRGRDAETATRPVKLLEFLSALCDEQPELTIYVLAWDFSFVYAQERESQQREKFTAAHPRIRFEWDAHPSAGGSHHQKFVVVDGTVGFLGGIDLCDARWDDCRHLAEDPERVNVVGDPCKPYHDVQACFTGAVVCSLVDVFRDRWQRATGEHLPLPAPDGASQARYDLRRLSHDSAQPIVASHAALSRTQVDDRAQPERIGEILALFAAAIATAQHSIYVETQYFTSRTIAELLIERMRNEDLPKLDIVVFMPHGADTAMEKMALEDTQDGVLTAVNDTARAMGHGLQLLYPASHDDAGGEIATFIHSKILSIDDRLLIVGSPNFTERSMALDSEIAVSWECTTEDDPLDMCIRDIRCELLAEHSGVPAGEFSSARGLCAKIETLLARGNTRLRRREVGSAGALGPVLAQIFDPGDAQLTKAALPPTHESSLDPFTGQRVSGSSSE